MNRKLCVLSWALFGISIACLTAVAPYALEWAEPVAAFHAGICSLLLIYSAVASLFSALGMSIPGGRKLLFFAIISSMMLFACLISGTVSIPFTACSLILAAPLALIVDFIAESQSFSENPIPEIASAILILLFAASLVAVFGLVEMPSAESEIYHVVVEETDIPETPEEPAMTEIPAEEPSVPASEDVSGTDEIAVYEDNTAIEDDSSAVEQPDDAIPVEPMDEAIPSDETVLGTEYTPDKDEAVISEDTESSIPEADAAVTVPAPPVMLGPVIIHQEPAEVPDVSDIVIPAEGDTRIPQTPVMLEPVIRFADEDIQVAELSAADATVPVPDEIPVVADEDTADASCGEIAADDARVPQTPVILEPVIRFADEDIQTAELSAADATVPVSDEISVVADEDTADASYGEMAGDDFWIPVPAEYATETVVEEDPWADFYIEGETALELEDGLYYMDLYVNESYIGMIEVRMAGGNPYMNAAAFKDYVQYSITKEALDRIFFDAPAEIGLDYLAEYGAEGSFDPIQYRIDVRFSSVDMPIQILSINSSSRRIQTRPIAGAVNLQPAIFSWMATHSLSARVYDFLEPAFWNDIAFTFSSRHQMRLFDVFLDFNFYLDWTINDFDFDFGSYKFYVDFPDEMIRLSWGNVDTTLLSARGTDVGIRFDKSLSYAPSGYRRGSNFEQLIEIETRSEVIIYNNGDGRTENEIFHRTLDPGVYRLMDFILYSGANTILIRIVPLDGSPVKESVIELQYSASLLEPGEIYYGASLTTGRIENYASADKDDAVVSLPILNNRRLDYDWRNLTLSGYLRAGLAPNVSGDFSLAVQNIPTDYSPIAINAQLAMEFTHLTSIGTTRYTANVYEYADDYGRFTQPYFNVRIGHQATTGWRPISSVTASISYDSPTDFSDGRNHDVSLSLGLSGSIGIFSWGLSGTLGTDVTDFSELYGSGVLSGSFYFSPNVSLNASFNIAGYADGSAPTVGGRIGLTLRFGKHSVNASGSESYASVTYDWYDDRNSVSARIDTSDYGDIHSYGTSASYSYSGDYVNVGANVSMDGLADGVGASVRVSTSTLFADGLFAISSSIPSNFLLVKQQGSLKGNRISIGAANSSDAQAVPMLGNTGFYTGLSSSNPGSLMVYSEGTGPIGSVYSEAVNLVASRSKGYVMWIDAEQLYSVAGTAIRPDNQPWINGSSPLYSVTIDEEGNVSLENTDNYIFTDSDGVFIASDLKPGMYAFDIDYKDSWILSIFEVKDKGQRTSDVLVLDSAEETDLNAGDIYSAVYMYGEGEVMSGDAFFSVLYPQEAV